MPVQIEELETRVEIQPERPAPAGLAGLSDSALRERLRPIVLEILHEEIERARRQGGRA